MAIDSIWEWVIVGAVVLVFFGSAKKIPDFARNLGRATGEFKKGQVEIQDEIKKAFNPDLNSAGTASKADEQTMELARNYGISTDNRPIGDIKRELSEKLKSGN
ncbi:MAG: twin-arginine translocase TatA/TatE family subunit [Candidatus Thermoplasmatota archaeon]|jgi:sec-independent protein translocase protein TatA|nr:twin-arginine translocase TatA/TatE family subunit [Candidatus Thermoplasmatota archaeon]MCL5988621.1 twin-arginine translocase TatA/TatE family subunit [Candidatus Thermoplasmatota archaeon]